ncbi:MAG: hypothetical protein IJJ23_03590 [Clostridia bacterium]|nr:hypothetical protein [Clostridia bacterium]
MSAIVDFAWYYNVYFGNEADQSSFPALCARAEDVIGAMTRWQVTAANIGTLSEALQTLYKKAICAQVDFFAVNGTETATGDSGGGWTVGKVTVQGKADRASGAGLLSGAVSPLAVALLEQTGLLNPQVPTLPEMPLLGWW